jgi:hypothetical protein
MSPGLLSLLKGGGRDALVKEPWEKENEITGVGVTLIQAEIPGEERWRNIPGLRVMGAEVRNPQGGGYWG